MTNQSGLDYKSLKKGDLIESTDGELVGEITGLVNFSARVYVTDQDGKQTVIRPEESDSYRVRTVKSGEIVQSDLPPMMNGQTYFRLCDELIAAHPEDLINIISRVLEQRADVEHIRTQPVPHSLTTSIETGQFTVPGCPGKADCLDPMHADGHLKIRDRKFTIAMRGSEVGYPCSDQPEAKVGYQCRLCGTVKPVDQLTTLSVSQGSYWTCKVECRKSS